MIGAEKSSDISNKISVQLMQGQRRIRIFFRGRHNSIIAIGSTLLGLLGPDYSELCGNLPGI